LTSSSIFFAYKNVYPKKVKSPDRINLSGLLEKAANGRCKEFPLRLRSIHLFTNASSIRTLTVGFGISPNRHLCSRAITAGRGFHPALKVSIQIFNLF